MVDHKNKPRNSAGACCILSGRDLSIRIDLFTFGLQFDV